jgi:hypothetical protein
MLRTLYSESFTVSREVVVAFGSVQGNGTNPPTIPTTTFSATSSLSFMSATNNFVSSTAGDITRTSAGIYTVKFKDTIPVVFDISVNVWGTSGMWSQDTDYNPTTRVLTFNTRNAGGTLTDITTAEFVKFTITGSLAVE